MYNQHDQLQVHTYTEAKKMALDGEEFSHLVKLLNPEYAMRLRIFVKNLPESIQEKTIYGRAHGKPATTEKKTKKR
jgi:hypothetical protein